MTTEWIDIVENGYPDFRVHGFHTGRRVWVKLKSGEELLGLYHGYGMFSVEGWSMLDDVVAWRPGNDTPE